MADRKPLDTSKKRGMDEKARPEPRQPGGTVGRGVPDESKERHTEIAVETGRKHGDEHDPKH